MTPLRSAVKSETWVEVMHNGKKMVTPCAPNTRGAFKVSHLHANSASTCLHFLQASLMDLQPDSILLPDVTMVCFSAFTIPPILHFGKSY